MTFHSNINNRPVAASGMVDDMIEIFRQKAIKRGGKYADSAEKGRAKIREELGI